MEHIIHLNDNINANDRQCRQDRARRRRIFRNVTFRSSRISLPICARNKFARERELEGARERVLVRDRGSRDRVRLRDSALFVMGRAIKRNTPIIIQLVISYFICLILTAIFLRYMFAL